MLGLAFWKSGTSFWRSSICGLLTAATVMVWVEPPVPPPAPGEQATTAKRIARRLSSLLGGGRDTPRPRLCDRLLSLAMRLPPKLNGAVLAPLMSRVEHRLRQRCHSYTTWAWRRQVELVTMRFGRGSRHLEVQRWQRSIRGPGAGPRCARSRLLPG